jgi:hypothetical protein
MEYHDELLKAASDLIELPETQATLRRAVSTACYAVFHLLIFEACQLWVEPKHWQTLSRRFGHSTMKEASKSFKDTFERSTTPAERSLASAAGIFAGSAEPGPGSRHFI